MSVCDRALAAPGLASYRYRGRYGWVMIGAKDDDDALVQAQRSIDDAADMSRLEIWEGTGYVSVTEHRKAVS